MLPGASRTGTSVAVRSGTFMKEAGFKIMPTEEQGTPFYRFTNYILSAIIEAGKSHDAIAVICCQNVRPRKQEWEKSI